MSYGEFLNTEALFLPVIEVYDGDTIFTRFTLPAPLNEIKVRIVGIDTPEMPAKSYHETGKLGRAKCVQEAERALHARDYLRNIIAIHRNVIVVDNYEWDKYGGRIDGDVYAGQGGTWVDLREEMIKAGLAVPYDGKRKTHSWC